MGYRLRLLSAYVQKSKAELPSIMWKTMETFFHDQEIQRALLASQDSARLNLQHMNFAQAFPGTRTQGFGYDRLSSTRLLEFSVDQAEIRPGLFLEFGVHEGESIRVIANKLNETIHGFDSFEGLPEAWKADSPKGAFDRKGLLPEVPDNVKLHKGWFEDTLPGFLKDNPGPISFLNIDCDLYSSTRFVLDQLSDRLMPGTVIHFDEYFNLPGWEQFEYKAWQETVAKLHIKYDYIGYTANAYAVAVKIREINGLK